MQPQLLQQQMQQPQMQQPSQQQLPANASQMPFPGSATMMPQTPIQGVQSLGAASAAAEGTTAESADLMRRGLIPPGEQQNRMWRQTPGAEIVDVKRNAPEINWEYAVIQRLNPEDLSTRLLPFNLGRLILGNDESQNLTLIPGDVVTIFSQRDLNVPMAQRTKFVRLEGEIRSPGIYKAEPGDTLRTMIQRAGGLTPGAYLYGSEFTRESLRIEQQRGLDATVRNIELAFLSRGQTGADLIFRLRQLRASGRMVLEIRPTDTSVDALPPLSLEDGDRLAIPSRPATVDVVGAVYNQNSYLFRSSNRVGDYLKMSGEGIKDADLKNMFLVRADGSVISRNRTSSKWSGGFRAINVLPGDVIVVPLKVIRPDRMKALQAWSQLFSQFAVGAASLAVVTGH